MSIVNMKTLATIVVSYGDIAWLKRNNHRKEYGETQVIENSLKDHGWLKGNPVNVVKIDERDLAEEMEFRRVKWDQLKSAVAAVNTLRNTAALVVFEKLFCKGKKLSEPIYSGNMAFRRASVYPKAMVERYVATQEDADRNILTEIPVHVVEYASMADKILDQQLENELQGVGTLEVGNLEKLEITKYLFDAGCSEAKIRKLYSSSTGQKTHGICQANVNWPKLNIYNRFMMPNKESAEWIPWGPPKGDELVKINNRFEATRKRREGLPLSKKEEGCSLISEKEVEQYFQDCRAKVNGDGQNAQKIMTKKEIESKAKNHPLKMVRNAMDSVIGNTEANLQVHNLFDHVESLNSAYDLVDKGNGKLLDLVVGVTTTDEQLMKDFAELCKAGKQTELREAIDRIKNPIVAPATAPEQPKVEQPKVEQPKVEQPKVNGAKPAEKKQLQKV